MKTMFRMLAGFGLLALGYYVGREVGKNDHIRRELEEMRNQQDPEAERRQVEPEVIGGRHVELPVDAHPAVRRLDCGAHLCLVGAVRPSHRVDHQMEPIVGVAAEGRNILVILRLECPLVRFNDLLLRVIVRQ